MLRSDTYPLWWPAGKRRRSEVCASAHNVVTRWSVDTREDCEPSAMIYIEHRKIVCEPLYKEPQPRAYTEHKTNKKHASEAQGSEP